MTQITATDDQSPLVVLFAEIVGMEANISPQYFNDQQRTVTDQLQAVTGGAIMAFLIMKAPWDQYSTECKVLIGASKIRKTFYQVEHF